MNPLEYIEKGIRTGSWKLVCKGYEQLTGLSIPEPENTKCNSDLKETLKEIGRIVNETLMDIDLPKNNKKPRKRKTKNQDESIDLDENKRTLTQKETGTIHFITNEPDPDEMEKNKLEAKRSKKNKATRPPVKKYNVKCNECEKTFESDRPEGEIGQKCRSCLKARINSYGK